MSVPSPYAPALAAIPARTRTVAVLGSQTSYREYGDPSGGPTVVMVHGFRGDHHGLEPVIAHLPGVHVLSPDLPGFGDSTPFADRRHDVAAYAAWLTEFVRVVAVPGPLVLVGHSFGSIVASAAVAGGLTPERLVLLNPIGAPALAGPRGVLTRLAVLYYRLGALLPERAGYALLTNRVIVRGMSVVMATTRDPQLRRFIHDQHDRYFSAFASRDVVLEAFEASVGTDVSRYADQISVPTLLVAAADDDITPLPAQYRLRTLFPDASLHIIDGVGHLIHYETPAEAAAALRTLLDELA